MIHCFSVRVIELWRVDNKPLCEYVRRKRGQLSDSCKIFATHISLNFFNFYFKKQRSSIVESGGVAAVARIGANSTAHQSRRLRTRRRTIRSNHCKIKNIQQNFLTS